MKLISVKPSTKSDKKYDATFEIDDHTKTTRFGQRNAPDYTKTHDKEQRARYIKRHSKNENWSDPTSAGSLSRHLLWGESTSMMENLRRYKNRFNL